MENIRHVVREINIYDLLPDFIKDARADCEVEEISADANNTVSTDGARGREIIGETTNQQRMIFLNVAASYNTRTSEELFFSSDSPFLSVMLPDGERLEGQHECLSIDGCSYSLRKFVSAPSLSELTEQGMMTYDQEDFLRCMIGKANIITAGETRSGKTTLVKAFINEIQDTIRWIGIEKNTELQKPKHGYRIQVNKVTTFEEAIQSALRSNPTLIIISEINSKDSAFAYVEAATTGHYGMSTIHAGSAEMVKKRMKMRLVGYDIPEDYIDLACNIVVHIGLRSDNSRYITEITGMQ